MLNFFIRRHTSGGLCFFACTYILSAQPTNLYFHHLTPAQGLSQSTISAIYRDRTGFVWIGTAEGLNRFDGVRVKTYGADPDDPHQLLDPTITSPIFEDRRGDLWFCTLSAIHRYRRQFDDFERFILLDADSVALKGYQVFGLDSQEHLWTYCNGQVYLFDLAPAATTPASKRFHPVLSIHAFSFRYFEGNPGAQQGTVYALKESGIVRYLAGPGGLTLRDTLFSGQIVRDVSEQPDGTVWAACRTGLWHRDPDGVERSVMASDGQSPGSVRSICPRRENHLFLTTDRGLYLLDKSSRQLIRQWASDDRNTAGLSTNNLAVLHIDTDDNLWVSAWTTGLDYTNLRKLKFQTRRFYTPDKSGKNQLFIPGPMLEDSRKRIWCCSQMQGLRTVRTNGTIGEDFSDLAPSPDQLFELGNGHLLVNNFGSGLSILDPDRKTVRPVLWQGKPVVRYHLAMLSAGVFVLASGNGIPGLLKLTLKGLDYVFEPIRADAVSAKEWYYVVRQSDHAFFVADENYAVHFYSDTAGGSLQPVVALPGYITCSMEDEESIWLGGSFGLCRIDRSDRSYTFVNTRDGLPDNMVYAILRLRADEFWLSTGKGLVRYDPQHNHFQKYDLPDGLQALEYNRRSCLLASDGTVWFGGIGGYNYFDPAAVQPLEIVPNIQLTDLQVNDGPYPYHDNPSLLTSIRLPYDSATLTFHFVGLEFSDPASNVLKYRLRHADGTPYDQDWVQCPDARGFARYANLPPGKYTFQILAANSDGIWTPVPKEIQVEITPPFYETWWFRMLVLAVLLLSIYAVYRSRLNTMRKKEIQKRRIIELELNALRAQLNPHFISNNLISINNYIRNNGVEKVRGYVATFARLMRNVLESARNPAVSLEEELQMLQNYVEVESGRFPQPVDFSVQLDAGLNTAQLFLPGMLLQPFVENAIVHGLAPRNGEGKIELTVRRDVTALVFTIEDNGAGAEKQKPDRSFGEKKSHGLDITRERLQLYDLQHHTTSSVHVEYLKKEDDTPMGTRVTLRLGHPQI